MLKWKLFFSMACLLALQSCSWVEYFSVINTTQTDAMVTYELDTTLKGFPLFHQKPSCYEITRNGKINWDIKAEFTDTNPASHIVSGTIPAGCVLIIGSLSNDSYTSYNQEFINGRKFNLLKISVECGEFLRQVTPSVFDTHFIKERGNVKMIIK